MTRIVADASVAVKWVAPLKPDEIDTAKALDLLARIDAGDFQLSQPPHWLAETAAIIVRLYPATAEDDISDLYETEFERIENPAIYSRACELSRDLNHHLFDTLYHAVALELRDTLLVTADERYYKKAKRHGRIALLSELRF
jgi:predicted nucleic acid-binding protein